MEQSHELHRFPRRGGICRGTQRDGVAVGSYAGRRSVGTRESAEIAVERPILLNQKDDVLNTGDVFRR